MTGVLILAAGVPRAFEDGDFGVMTLGYVVMRLAMVALWLRAGLQHAEGRPSALRYAIGIAVVQVGWVARLWLPDDAGLVAFFVLAAIELAVPIWAEQAGRTPWHPRHIAERYGLFTIIVLGESVLSATVGVQAAIDLDTPFGDLGFVIVGGLLTVFAMWWIYFDLPNEQLVERVRRDFAAHIRGRVHVGIRTLPRVRVPRPRSVEDSSSRSTTSRTTPTSPVSSPRSRSPSPCASSCSRCGRCTTGSSGPRGCGAGPCRRRSS